MVTPEKPDVFFDFEEGVRGIGDAANQLGPSADVVPIISGNVSFYNESASGQAVVPSPVICCIGKMPNAQAAHRMQLTNEGAHVVLIGQRYAEMAETQYASALDDLGVSHQFSTVPHVRFPEEKAMNTAMLEMNQSPVTQAVHDVSQGGVWQALVEMVAGDRNWPFVGLELQCPDDISPDVFLFSENAGYLCEVLPEHLQACQDILARHHVPFWVIGRTNNSHQIALSCGKNPVFDVSVNDVLQAFNSKNLVTPGTPIYNKSL